MHTVLLVDDDSESLWSLQLSLEGRGHHVVLARNGADALNKLLRGIPRLIITDWQMPEMDGAELCRHVRCNPALAHLPIILLSAMPEPGHGPPCWSAFFRKPADLSALMRTVDALAAERLAGTVAPLALESPMASRWQAVNPRCWP
ncbi:response regulator [Paraburkholderia sp. UCT31]|uniref:response regulator n=1 Tax=Paraburkholderia sp. UCT31 TaxID=2615209 RepID=UPI0016563271|nr:response regulator [Paraburkholderia sp. UCT31]MBC8740408.1 response regulator [Paraburkholderia sp. UCT31]